MLKQNFCGSNNLKCNKFHNQVIEHMDNKEDEVEPEKTKDSEEPEEPEEKSENAEESKKTKEPKTYDVDNSILDQVVKYHQKNASCKMDNDEGKTKDGVEVNGVCIIDQDEARDKIKENLSVMKDQSVLNYHIDHMLVSCTDKEGTEGGKIDGVCYINPDKYAKKVQELIEASNADDDNSDGTDKAEDESDPIADLKALVQAAGKEGGDDVEKFLNEAFKMSEGFSNRNYCTY